MASYAVKQSTTAYPLVFLMVQSADHLTGATGLSPTVTLSKAGAAFASPAGAVTEIANGWYKVAGNATDSNTLGSLVLHATSAGADPSDTLYEVVAVDPQATSYGLLLAKTTNLTGLNDIAASAIVSSGAITTSGGKVSEVTLCDTLTTYTGNTLQTGDSFARLGAPTGASIAADIQTRSVYAGGAVASVTAAVTAGTVSDKTGYSLAAGGLDSITTTEPDTSTNGAMSTWNFRLLLRWAVSALSNGTRTLSGGAGTLTVKKLGGTTATSQTIADDGAGNETLGAPT